MISVEINIYTEEKLCKIEDKELIDIATKCRGLSFIYNIETSPSLRVLLGFIESSNFDLLIDLERESLIEYVLKVQNEVKALSDCV